MAGALTVVIIGGGAAGFFAAIACARRNTAARVILCEATAHPLAKVRVSGGGRCNVTHACFEPREMIQHYPRGGRELTGAFHRWQPRDTVEWFAAEGVELKTEEDGRMFPVTDDSATIVNCLLSAAQRAGVDARTRCGVAEVGLRTDGGELRADVRSQKSEDRGQTTDDRGQRADGGSKTTEEPGKGVPEISRSQDDGGRVTRPRFIVRLTTGETLACDRLLVATGGNRSSAGFTIARAMGHTIEPLAPSLFTFHVDDPRLKGLAGVSVDRVDVCVAPVLQGPKSAALHNVALSGSSGTSEYSQSGPALHRPKRDAGKYGTRPQSGPLLVTHVGLSGPAVLKLSSWEARELAAADYRFGLRINFVPGATHESVVAALVRVREENPRKQAATWCPFGLPLRLWERLLAASLLDPAQVWTGVSNEAIARLAAQLVSAEFAVSGKTMNKEEFVTCGGVKLSEVDFRTMESKRCPGLHFAGEVLDIDGVTGGFNFQAAWTTGWLAGQGIGSADS